jgi:cytochrome c oxidase cbb3-type subunit III
MRMPVTILLLLIVAASSAAAGEGKPLYERYCVQCHGLNGNGKGINSPYMSVAPRDHTNRTEMSGRTDEELFRVIRNGGASINQSVLMPSWKHNLDDGQINDLVRYLRQLCCEDQ